MAWCVISRFRVDRCVVTVRLDSVLFGDLVVMTLWTKVRTVASEVSLLAAAVRFAGKKCCSLRALWGAVRHPRVIVCEIADLRRLSRLVILCTDSGCTVRGLKLKKVFRRLMTVLVMCSRALLCRLTSWTSYCVLRSCVRI